MKKKGWCKYVCLTWWRWNEMNMEKKIKFGESSKLFNSSTQPGQCTFQTSQRKRTFHRWSGSKLGAQDTWQLATEVEEGKGAMYEFARGRHRHSWLQTHLQSAGSHVRERRRTTMSSARAKRDGVIRVCTVDCKMIGRVGSVPGLLGYPPEICAPLKH